MFGCGGVGLNVIQGAAIAGAERIIAIDTLEAKLEMAKKFGATDTILAKPGEDTAKALKKLTGGGPDYAFECVGVGALAETAYRAIRRGGKAVIVGVARPTDATSFKPMSCCSRKRRLQGSYFGSCVPRIDFPRMLHLYMAGQAQARRAHHAPLQDRRSAAGLRRPRVRPQRARRDRLLMAAPGAGRAGASWSSTTSAPTSR